MSSIKITSLPEKWILRDRRTAEGKVEVPQHVKDIIIGLEVNICSEPEVITIGYDQPKESLTSMLHGHLVHLDKLQQSIMGKWETSINQKTQTCQFFEQHLKVVSDSNPIIIIRKSHCEYIP